MKHWIREEVIITVNEVSDGAGQYRHRKYDAKLIYSDHHGVTFEFGGRQIWVPIHLVVRITKKGEDHV